MKDKRKRPQIPTGTIAQAIIEMVPRGQESLLDVDQEMRLPEIKAWYGSKREMVVSDTTLSRSLEGFALAPVKKVLREQGDDVISWRDMRRAEDEDTSRL